MDRPKHLVLDVVFLSLSIACAWYISVSGVAHTFVATFGDLRWPGIFLSGVFFTSLFTAAPSIIILGEFAGTTTLVTLSLIGGAGAVLGDYIIFRFFRDRMKEDFDYLLSIAKAERLSFIYNTRLFRLFVPFVGAAIIASPLPDEVGVALLGLSGMKPRFFVVLSFILNALGILAIGFLAKATL